MVSPELLVSLVPMFPLIGFLIVSMNARRLSEGATAFLACGVVLFSFALSTALFVMLASDRGQTFSVTWFHWFSAGDLHATFGFLVDPLSVLFMMIITGVGFLIHVYSAGYMHNDDGFNRFFGYLNLFIFFMLLLVMGDSYLIMFIGWEGVGLCSYLLIGFWFRNQEYNSAANKAFIMNRIGDLGMLIGIIMIIIHFGDIRYSSVFPQAGSVPTGILTTITLLLFVGAIGKSAQIPLYTWLPDAMAGPTPVSALIHAATMVTAGIYMVARNNVLYSLSPATLEVVMAVGLVTALLAATIAVAQNDIKKVLAYSTVSQLGLMFLALGLGSYTSGIFHVATHAFFKALLFLGAGSIIHALQNEQDLRNMGGLKKHMPVTYLTFLAGVLAISGIPPFAGFFSKDEILASAFASSKIVWALAVLVSLLTAFYMFRLFFLAFYGTERADKKAMDHIHESPQTITVPLIVLAVLSTLGGFMGIPEALGGSHWLEEFLSPVFAAAVPVTGVDHLSHPTEYALMGTLVALTLVLIFVAYNWFIKKLQVPAPDNQVKGLAQVFARKYYVDELYHALFVKPLYWASGKLDVLVERLGIDRTVNSLGKMVVLGGRKARFLQDGGIGYYIFVMVIGIVLILTFSVRW